MPVIPAFDLLWISFVIFVFSQIIWIEKRALWMVNLSKPFGSKRGSQWVVNLSPNPIDFVLSPNHGDEFFYVSWDWFAVRFRESSIRIIVCDKGNAGAFSAVLAAVVVMVLILYPLPRRCISGIIVRSNSIVASYRIRLIDRWRHRCLDERSRWIEVFEDKECDKGCLECE